jgi:uncharacterized protein YkwD
VESALPAFPPEPSAADWDSTDLVDRGRGAARRHRRAARAPRTLLAGLAVAVAIGSAVVAVSVVTPARGGPAAPAAKSVALPGAADRDPGSAAALRSGDGQLAAADPVPTATPGRASRSGTRSSPPARSGTAATTSAPAKRATRDPQEEAVLALVNTARTGAGCASVSVDLRLATAARAHSADMAARNYFAHNTPEGKTPGDRVRAAGYGWSAVGENIAAGQPDAATVMRDWMDSPGHRANILNCGYRDIGIGLARNGAGKPYWTQDFGTPG